jgi:sugar O-acyltransferase (sialic acid O-acetyltransferase NeuD family)
MNSDESNPADLIIVGAGGAGQEALWVARRQNEAGPSPVWTVVGFADDNPTLANTLIDGVPVLGSVRAVLVAFRGRNVRVHLAIGNNQRRKRLAKLWRDDGFRGATLVDPTAVIAPTALVGEGTFIGPLTIVAPHARVGNFVLINTHVGVGHHASVGDYAQLCPGARVSGECKIDSGAFVGSNAVVHPGQSIGEGAMIGAVSFVIRSVKPRHSVLGVPARIVSRPAENGLDAQSQP